MAGNDERSRARTLSRTDPPPAPRRRAVIEPRDEPSEAQVRRARRRARRLWGASLAFVASSSLAAVVWMSLPSETETLRMARGVQFDVAKRDDGARIELVGNRDEYAVNVPLAHVAPAFVDAVVATEDRRFHGDWRHAYLVARFVQAGPRCVGRKLASLGRARCAGHSGLSQQLAKLLGVPGSRTLGRKVRELLWALKMEATMTPEAILEAYVNRIPLGARVVGVEAAAREHFGKSAAELSLEEAAVLAAAVRRPAVNWSDDPVGAAARADLVLGVMHREDFLSDLHRLPPGWSPVAGQRRRARPFLGHYWQWLEPRVREALREHPPGRYKVSTFADAEVQVYAERELRRARRALRAKGVVAEQGAVVVMRADGRVLAMVGGNGDDVGSRGVNRAVAVRGRHCRPPASVMKAMTYTAALERGLSLESSIDASPVHHEDGSGRVYRPSNHDGRVYGALSLRDAFVGSVNTATVRLLIDRVRYDDWLDTVARFGIPVQDMPRELGNSIGQSETCLIDLVGAYGTIASSGRESRPRGLASITDAAGRRVFVAERKRGRRVFRKRTMRAVHELLVAAVAEGTGTAARRGLEDLEIAGKTGTSDGFADALFVGYAGDLVVGTWIGNDVPRPMPSVYGGTAPARVFNGILTTLRRHTNVLGRDGATRDVRTAALR